MTLQAQNRPITDERGCDVEAIHPTAVMEARRAVGDAPAPDGIATLFAVLGDPTRIKVLTALSSGELCVCDLAASTGVNRSTISHQLRVLRNHRLVRRRREGKIIYYDLDDDHIVQLLALASAHAGESVGLREEVSA